MPTNHVTEKFMLYLFGLFYGGPDTILPVASSLAAIGGVFLLCWKYVLAALTRLKQVFRKQPE
jgi:hypothetical protein